MKKFLGILLIVPLLLWTGVRLWKAEIDFNVNCGGYMQNAANANTVELATKEMAKVIQCIDDRHMEPGFTSVLYKSPDEDVGFWISNMKSSLVELQQLKPDATSLEKSNVLIKLRETLTHKTSKDGGAISVPDGISIYPYNMAYAVWATISTILALIGVLIYMSEMPLQYDGRL